MCPLKAAVYMAHMAATLAVSHEPMFALKAVASQNISAAFGAGRRGGDAGEDGWSTGHDALDARYRNLA